MKKLILSVTAIAGLTLVSDAQQVLFQDVGNNSYDTLINGVPNYTQDLNLELLVGSGATATIDVVTLLLSQTTAAAASSPGTTQPPAGDIAFTEGTIYDNTAMPMICPPAALTIRCLPGLGITAATLPLKLPAGLTSMPGKPPSSLLGLFCSNLI